MPDLSFSNLKSRDRTFDNVRENATIYQDTPVIYDPLKKKYVRAKQPMTEAQASELVVLGEILHELKRLRMGLQMLTNNPLQEILD